jgi:hypothetical protein
MWRLYKTGYWIGSQYSYTLTTESLTITTDSHNWQVTTPAESLQGPGPPADPTGSHWPSTNSSGFFSATHRQLTRNWLTTLAAGLPYIACEQTTKKTPSPIPLLLYDVITGTTTKKTTVSSIVALLSNGCKQALPLLTVDLQRARHIMYRRQLDVGLIFVCLPSKKKKLLSVSGIWR